LAIQEVVTWKAALDTVATSVSIGTKNSTVAKNAKRYGQASLGFDIGVWSFEKTFSTEPDKLIADIPQEMLLSLPSEFSNVVLLLDSLAFNFKETLEREPIVKIPVEPPVKISPIPNLFLFDVSGSMNENGKIGQARDAGLDALREMREGGGENSSPVSIMTFSGACGGNTTRNLLSFTNSLSDAETVMRRLPAPGGETPLPQAKDTAWAEMERFLAAKPNIKEGRIVVLSDGQSTCGAIRPPGVFSRDITTVSRSDSKIKFFTIGLDVPAGSIAERDLQYLASETGGKYFAASDRRQLIRAFQKQVRRFAPRPCSAANADFSGGLRAFTDSDYGLALESFRRYAAANPDDSCGVYNLALAFEANDRYKTAAEFYRQYLNSASASPDRAKIEQKIVQLNQDYADQFDYFINLIQSDADYLRRYYDSIFNRSSADLAQEFNGFVYEKGNFYKTLPEILEVSERWLINDAKDISSSIDTLSRRSRLESFDRDAVSLLTVPISEIRDLLERMRNYQANSFR
jgi:Mg-chelatase subunit ChlD